MSTTERKLNESNPTLFEIQERPKLSFYAAVA